MSTERDARWREKYIISINAQDDLGQLFMEKPRFLSLRWRIFLPLYVIILVIVATGAYLLARETGASPSAANILQQSRRAIDQQAIVLYENQQHTVQNLAAMDGLAQALVTGDTELVRSALETRARRANLDDVLLLNTQGEVVLGLRREADGTGYETLNVANVEGEGLRTVAREFMLYSRAAVEKAGTVMVGQRLPWMLSSLHTSAMADAALFGPDGQLLASTLPDAPAPEQLDTVQSLHLAGEQYETLYFPLTYGGTTIGSIGLLLSERALTASAVGQQLTGLLVAALAASVLIVIFTGLSWMTGRVNRITRTAELLAHGERTARTNMQPTDEIGRMGQALDQYANYAQEKQDELRVSLRRQRRENERLTAVLEALSDGVIVQDLDGRVLVMNEKARELLGSSRVLRSNPDLQELTAFVTDRLGPALAPGIYALGDVQRIRLDNRVLDAQAAAVMSVTQQRIGTVITVRDVTAEVQVEAAREKILQHIQADIQEPLADLVQARPSVQISHEIRQHATALQKMILDMRNLTDSQLRKVTDEQQRPLMLDTLVWSVANEWRQVAQAQNLKLHVAIEKPSLYVLGEERRLRWAIGNIIDNAIKYTPPGGDVMLEVQEETGDGRAHLRVRDNGVGISREELPHVFTRFFRGKPVTAEGRAIRVPGSGQGLTIARQIFEAHGGSISIKSKPNVGTAVYFTIPLTSPVSLELPPLTSDLEEETVRIDTRHLSE
jgi:signal transduction histidine kinase